MGDASVKSDSKGAEMKLAFQSKELEEVLDIIDKLRSQGISRYIDLPQLIVCGDQSSGKSSVLEAVSGVRFPTKDNLCTRFPTELILRRSPQATSCVTIVPDISCEEDEKSRVKNFQVTKDVLENFEQIMDSAGEVMGLGKDSKRFSTHVLRVELSRPFLPHLTLVDLPGLFHAGSKTQSDEDADAVKSLVNRYMKSPRSIILAVVSARNDYSNQIVTKYAHDVDPKGHRTLGIVTKPDCLHSGSESEAQYVGLIRNEDVHLRLGWHVLRNRSFEEKDCSSEERDETEAAFFSKGIWTSLDPEQTGISSLKPRLTRVLRDQILTELPGLTQDVETAITECESRLDKLGTSRSNSQDQMLYLHKISQEYNSYLGAALKGSYDHQIFQDSPSASSYHKRLRAVVFNLLDDFTSEMTLKGHKYQIVEEPSEETVSHPILVSRHQRLQHVKSLVKHHRGMELPGFQRCENITMLLREQCTPWEDIVKKFANQIFNQVKIAMSVLLDEVSDPVTADGISRYILNPALEKIKERMNLGVKQNLEQHLQGAPITFNHYFTDNLQKLRAEHDEEITRYKLQHLFSPTSEESEPFFSQSSKSKSRATRTAASATLTIETIINALKVKSEADMHDFTCSEALYFMEAYYKVALKFFVDDFSIHTIEQCLLDELPTIFNPGTVLTLDHALISDIAGESAESVAERASFSAKLIMLKEAIRLLHQLDRGRAQEIDIDPK